MRCWKDSIQFNTCKLSQNLTVLLYNLNYWKNFNNPISHGLRWMKWDSPLDVKLKVFFLLPENSELKPVSL